MRLNFVEKQNLHVKILMSTFHDDKSLERIHMEELFTVYVEFSQPLLWKKLGIEADIPHIHWG